MPGRFQLAQCGFRFLPVPHPREERASECQQFGRAAVPERFVAGIQGPLRVAEIFKSSDPGNPGPRSTRRGCERPNTGFEPAQSFFLPAHGSQGRLIRKRVVLVVLFEAGCQPEGDQRAIGVALLLEEVTEHMPGFRTRRLPF